VDLLNIMFAFDIQNMTSIGAFLAELKILFKLFHLFRQSTTVTPSRLSTVIPTPIPSTTTTFSTTMATTTPTITTTTPNVITEPPTRFVFYVNFS